MRIKRTATIVTIVATLTLFLAISSTVAGLPVQGSQGLDRITLVGSVASKISCQGRLTDAGGNPLNGIYNHIGGLSDTTGLAWVVVGAQAVTVTEVNERGSVAATHTITLGFDLVWRTIAGGGGHASSADYALDSSIGQPTTRVSDNASYRLGTGYWYVAAVPVSPPEYRVYLPSIFKNHP